HQPLLTVSLVAQLKDLLLPKQIHGQSCRDDVGQILRALLGKIFGVILKNQRVSSLIEFDEFAVHSDVERPVAIIQVIDLALQQLIICVTLRVDEVDDAKWLPACGKNV